MPTIKKYNYSYEDGRIVRTTECDVTLDSGELVTKKNLVNSILYYYDAFGQLLTETVNGSAVNTMTYDSYGNIRTKNGIIYNNTPYYFYKNQQGDIIEITDRNTAVVARYSYDAWGKVTAIKDANGTTITSTTHIANVNSFRYRGYYYDVETKLYYLQSRYYDPVVGRFVNGDETGVILGGPDNHLDYNLYLYCYNEPVQGYDPSGEKASTLVGAGIQIEVSYKAGSFGLEVIWYLSKKVKGRVKEKAKPYIYVYGGASASINKDTKKVLEKIIAKPKLLFKPKSLCTGGFGLSVCVFAIFGYSNFNSPKSYLGWFDEAYANAWHVKGYTSWSSTCFVVGAGWCSGSASAGYAKSYYWLLDKVFSSIKKLYDTTVKKAKTL